MPRFLPPIVIGVLAGALGCASTQERSAMMQREVEEMIQVYGPACERLGYKRDDDKWRDCVVNLSSRAELRHSRYRTTTCIGDGWLLNCSAF